MSAIDQQFDRLRAAGKKALIPFVTAGDPDLAFTASVLSELAARGCPLCEVGIPYSDPIADGPVIQASYTRALGRHVHLRDILAQLDLARFATMPLLTMVSYAIIFRHGLERYIADAKASGVAGAIVPDLLADEAGPLAEICRREDFSLVQLVTPTTSRERALRIADRSSGFLYYVSVTGITGERQLLPARLTDDVGWLRKHTQLPVCVGFGISHEDQARQLREVADGIIVGSAFVRRIAGAEHATREEVLKDVGSFASRLLAALDADGP
jgi:tryptophan synthase alpha chain